MKKWKGWWIPTPVTGKEKDSGGCYAAKQTRKCCEIPCHDCIYWTHDGQAERRVKEYLEYLKEHKQGKEQARDSKGRFCKKGETVMLWEGFTVPTDPKREWGEWMCSEKQCPGTPAGIQCIYGETATCAECIYSRYNYEARRCFYEQYYGKYPTSDNNELPKLTVEVFKRSDCPEWAKWAAMDIDGSAYWFENKPVRHNRAWLGGTYDFRFKSIPENFDSSDWEHSLIERPQKELPKLTKEVFNRPDCPDWAQYAVLDKRGMAYYTQYKPVAAKDDVALDWLVDGSYRKMSEEHFDASDWQNSLIERPAKELPKLTQTAFHCPDCPKEATKLKVFPANHVVALDKDDKVLSVMELQCKEGEVNKAKAEWYYNKEADILYYGKDFEYTDPPIGADPVNVSYLPSDALKGTAVHKAGALEDVLIVDVKGSLVTLVGVKGKDRISMVTLILDYRITCNGDRCCVIEPLQ